MSIPDYLRLLRREPQPPHVCPVGLSEVARGDVLRLLAEYGSCIRDEMRCDPQYRQHDIDAARELQHTYIREIDSLLKGITP